MENDREWRDVGVDDGWHGGLAITVTPFLHFFQVCEASSMCVVAASQHVTCQEEGKRKTFGTVTPARIAERDKHVDYGYGAVVGYLKRCKVVIGFRRGSHGIRLTTRIDLTASLTSFFDALFSPTSPKCELTVYTYGTLSS